MEEITKFIGNIFDVLLKTEVKVYENAEKEYFIVSITAVNEKDKEVIVRVAIEKPLFEEFANNNVDAKSIIEKKIRSKFDDIVKKYGDLFNMEKVDSAWTIKK